MKVAAKKPRRLASRIARLEAERLINRWRLKQLAISTPKRIRKLPEVPTLIESGVPFDAITWSGLFAPARTSPAIVNKLGAELRSILKLSDVQEKLASDGNDFGDNTPQSLAVFVTRETEKYRLAVKVVGNRTD